MKIRAKMKLDHSNPPVLISTNTVTGLPKFSADVNKSLALDSKEGALTSIFKWYLPFEIDGIFR